MVAMVEARRRDNEREQPVLWRKSEWSAALTRVYFTALLFAPSTIMLVAADGPSIGGFLIARGVRAPPVYAVSGRTALVDDFTVASPDLWPSVGALLLDRLRILARASNWRQIVVISAEGDLGKNALVGATGLTVASRWWTQPL
jgi:hypothetical protein